MRLQGLQKERDLTEGYEGVLLEGFAIQPIHCLWVWAEGCHVEHSNGVNMYKQDEAREVDKEIAERPG